MDQFNLCIQFNDEITNENECILAIAGGRGIVMDITIERNGDIHFVLPRSTCEQLIDWLQKALEVPERKTTQERSAFPGIGCRNTLGKEIVAKRLKDIHGHPTVIGATLFKNIAADEGTHDQAYLIIRVDNSRIGIISFVDGTGEIEISPPRSVCSSFAEWLKKAFEMTSLDKKR